MYLLKIKFFYFFFLYMQADNYRKNQKYNQYEGNNKRKSHN